MEGIFKYKYADAIHKADSEFRDLGEWALDNNSHHYVAVVLNEVEY